MSTNKKQHLLVLGQSVLHHLCAENVIHSYHAFFASSFTTINNFWHKMVIESKLISIKFRSGAAVAIQSILKGEANFLFYRGANLKSVCRFHLRLSST